MSSLKHCNRCDTTKRKSEFYKRTAAVDGLQQYCKECDKQWRKDNPGKVKEYNVEWRKANPEKVKEWEAEWRKANPEQVRKLVTEWRKANPEKVKEYNRKSRLKRKALK